MEQTKGSTLDRQIGNCSAFATQKGWELASAPIIDSGRSAYTGDNIKNGSLGTFADKVIRGLVPLPAVLVVEELDRLSRQPADVMLSWLSPLVRAGITIAVCQTGQIIDSRMFDHDMGGVMTILITAFGSHTESRKKAERVAAAWDKKRRDAADGKAVQINHRYPAWLKATDRGFEEREEYVAIVRRIFDLRVRHGMGKNAIAKTLNSEGTKPWATTSRQADFWRATYIGRVLRNRAVLGEWQPHTKARRDKRRVAIGEPITNYYPSIIDPAIFAAANDKRAENQRKHQGRGKAVNNLLGNKARCGSCGGQMVALGSPTYKTNKSGEKHRYYFLYCQNAKVAKTCNNQRGWTYDRIEKPILDTILSLAMDDQHFSKEDGGAAAEKKVLLAKAKVDNIQTKISRLLDMVEDGDESATERYRMRKVEHAAARAELNAAEEELSKERGKVSSAEHLKRVGEVRETMGSADPEERFQARSRVKAALDDIIESAKFYPETGHITVLLIDMLRLFSIDHAGKIIGDLDFVAMSPQNRPNGRHGKVTIRQNGQKTVVNDLSVEQDSIVDNYLRRRLLNPST